MLRLLVKRHSGTAQIFERQKKIGEELKAVRQLGKSYVQQTGRWADAVRACDFAVRELGDFQNFLNVLTKETEELATTLQRLASQKRTKPAENDQRG